MNYTVRITDTAKQDLHDIAVWIAEKAGDRTPALRFIEKLRNECRKLEMFPNAGALPNDRVLRNAGYRFMVYSEYLIFYLVDEQAKCVNVMAVFHAKRDYMRVLRNNL